MAYAYTALRDRIENELGDSANARWETTDIDDIILKSCSEISELLPYRIRTTLKVEGRYGTATSTLSGSLVDATNAQFVAGDVGKVIKNTTDNTWAIVTACTSTTTVALSKNIMASGESYIICNKHCTNQKQVYIGDYVDFLKISQYDGVRYKGSHRDFKLLDQRRILELTIYFTPPSNKDGQQDEDVEIIFDYPHMVSQLTDFAGAVTTGYAAGIASVGIDGLSGTEVIAEGTFFTINYSTDSSGANLRETYRVAAAVTLSGGATTAMTFKPGLECAILDNYIVNFKDSTLEQDIEDLFIELVIANCLSQRAPVEINAIATGRGDPVTQFYQMGQDRRKAVMRRIENKAGYIVIPRHTRY